MKRQRHSGKIIAGLFVAGVAALVGWRLLGGTPEEQASGGGGASGGAVAVETAKIERRDLRETRAFTGSLEAHSEFDIVARVSGRLMALEVDIGDRVTRGQVIARLEDDEFVQQLRQAEAEKEMAEANIAEAESDLLVAERELERVRALRGREIAAEADLDNAAARVSAAEARLRVAHATLTQREAALEMARLRLSYTQVRATWEGPGDERAIAARFVSEGANIGANDPLVTLVNVSTLRGVIFVTERDYALIRPGQEAAVSVDALPGESFSARVSRVAPVFQAGSRQARVEIEVDNADGLLGPGMFARVRLGLRQAPDAISVPRDSIVRRNGREGIFLIDPDEDRARFVPVDLGIRDGVYVQVLSPEISGTIVTLGQNQLTNGASVRIVGTEPAPEAMLSSNG